MATDIDTFAIKQQIVTILKTNSTLFSATGADNKVRVIEEGAPRMSILKTETTLPHIWVTHENTIDTLRQIGAVQSNAIKGLEHTMFFRIILIAQRKRGSTVEEVIDDFVKLIKQEITEDYNLGATVDSCIVQQVRDLETSLVGHDRQGQVVILKAVASSG